MDFTYTINFEPFIRLYMYGFLVAMPIVSCIMFKIYKKQKLNPYKLRFLLEVCVVCLLSWLGLLMIIRAYLIKYCESNSNKFIEKKEYKKFYVANTIMALLDNRDKKTNFDYVWIKPQMRRFLDRNSRLDMGKVSFKDIKTMDRLCGKNKILEDELLDEVFFNKNKNEYWVWENVSDTWREVSNNISRRFVRRYTNKYFYFRLCRMWNNFKFKERIKKAKSEKERKYYERMLED